MKNLVPSDLEEQWLKTKHLPLVGGKMGEGSSRPYDMPNLA